MVIVGAGVIGLASAWRAAQAGLRVRVIERAEPGSGASGVAAGMLAPVGEATWGEEALLDAALASHAMWPEFVAELAEAGGDESSLIRNGALHVALDADEAAELRRRFDLMRSLGLEAEWLTGRECRELEPGLGPSAYAGNIRAARGRGRSRRDHRGAPRARARRAGAEIVSGRRRHRSHRGRRARSGASSTEDGAEHLAESTVLAAGAWSGTVAWLPESALASGPARQGPDHHAARAARRSRWQGASSSPRGSISCPALTAGSSRARPSRRWASMRPVTAGGVFELAPRVLSRPARRR